MAHNLTKEQIAQMPPRKYKAIRDELQTGDIVFCSGNYLFSKLIRRFTKSVWSHVGIIYNDDSLGRVLILESEKAYGVRLAPLSKYVKDYHGKNKPYKGMVVIARVSPALEKAKLNKAISFGLDELTKPYDNWEVLRVAIRTVLGIGKKEKNREYICSELVQACFHQIGIEFKDNDTKISPNDIWLDERVSLLFRIL